MSLILLGGKVFDEPISLFSKPNSQTPFATPARLSRKVVVFSFVVLRLAVNHSRKRVYAGGILLTESTPDERKVATQ